MQINWNDKDPIYRQLHDRILELILEGIFKDGDVLPSIRDISRQHRINHITVSKALQMLIEEDLVEKRRGLGMYVAQGAGKRLTRVEKKRFLDEEWPLVLEKIDRLGLSVEVLLQSSRDVG